MQFQSSTSTVEADLYEWINNNLLAGWTLVNTGINRWTTPDPTGGDQANYEWWAIMQKSAE